MLSPCYLCATDWNTDDSDLTNFNGFFMHYKTMQVLTQYTYI